LSPYSIAIFIFDIAVFLSLDPNILLPATKQFAPCYADFFAVS